MSPRTYSLGKRGPSAQKSRERVVDAARKLLTQAGFHAVSVEQVATQAGVTRVTVYNQFGSKLGLLEAILDELGQLPENARIQEAVAISDPKEALRSAVLATCQLWASERDLFRRVMSLPSADPETASLIEKRETARRAALQGPVEKLAKQGGLGQGVTSREALHVVAAITHFSSFDSLSRLERASPHKVAALMVRLISSVIALGVLEG